MEKDSFVFYKSWWEDIKDEPEDIRLAFYDAVMAYVFDGRAVTPDSGALRMYLKPVRPTLDKDIERYMTISEVRRNSGRKGGTARNSEASASSSKQTGAKQANASFAKQNKRTEAKQANASFAKQSKQAEANSGKCPYNDNEYDNDYIKRTLQEKGDGKKEEAEQDAYPASKFDLSFVTPDFVPVFNRWIRYQEMKERPFLDVEALKASYDLLRTMSSGDAKEAMRIVLYSKAQNYTGLVKPPKDGNDGGKRGSRFAEGQKLMDGQAQDILNKALNRVG